VEEYLDALEKELSLRFGDAPPTEVDTIYFGGGTPSQLGGEGLSRALGIVARRFVPASGAEVTAEANPDDIVRESVLAWRGAGINRLSLGAQSFDERALEWMHRTHDSTAVRQAVATARDAGITNLSLDLIFALPSVLERDFGFDVEQVLVLEPDHVSLYGLTIEPATPLGRWVARGRVAEQPEEGYESDYLTAHRMLTSAGFGHYEVSNYARVGRRAVHNSAYWSGVPYVGLGPAAHGFDGVTRRWNARAYAEWRDRVKGGVDPVGGSEELTAENRIAESVYLGLRSDTGLEFIERDRGVVASWLEAGWLTHASDGLLRCTPEGWLRLDSLAAALTHHRSP
jgi:oxygen-independent coproporphyrinogen III oxidase